MKINICPICVAVSSLWFGLSAGIASGYLTTETFIIPIALLMGGTVVGIMDQGEKRCIWAANHPMTWRTLTVSLGMPIAYLFITHINKTVVFIEFILLLNLAYLFFIKKSQSIKRPDSKVSGIEKQMEQCC